MGISVGLLRCMRGVRGIGVGFDMVGFIIGINGFF